MATIIVDNDKHPHMISKEALEEIKARLREHVADNFIKEDGIKAAVDLMGVVNHDTIFLRYKEDSWIEVVVRTYLSAIV